MGSDGDTKLEPEPSNGSSDDKSKNSPTPVRTGTAGAATAEFGSADSHHAIFQTVGALFTWVAICLTGFFALCFFLTAHHLFSPGFKAGQRVTHDLVAKRSSLVVDEEATEAAQKKARNSVVPVFARNKGADDESVRALKKKLNTVALLQKAGITPDPDTASLTATEYAAIICASDKEFNALIGSNHVTAGADKSTEVLEKNSNPSDETTATKDSLSADLKAKWTKVTSRDSTRQTLVATVTHDRDAIKKIKQEHPELDRKLLLLALSARPADLPAFTAMVESAQARLSHNCSRLPQDCQSEVQQHAFEYLPDSMAQQLRHLAADLMASSSVPNLEIDKEATEARLQNTASAVKPVMKHINVGQLIVPKNTILSQGNVDNLESIGVNDDDVNQWPLVLSLWLSLAAAAALVGLFLYAYEPKHLFSSPSVALMFTLSTVVCALATTIGSSYPAFVPLPAVALLLTIFLGQRVAIAISIPIAIFLAVDRLVDTNNLIALGTAAGAAIGVYSGRRHSLIASGLVMSVAQGVAFFLTSFISYPGHGLHPAEQIFAELFPKILVEFGGGMVSAITAIGFLPFLENIFGMVTPFRLAEMTDAEQPLLRRLEENAPGTYQHSLAVANLAEAGARAIGGDVNLVRAGAYYHDVGKMVRPRFFIENQLGDKNPHDSMSPEDSRERVLAHVTDGLVLAKEYNLPKAVQDFIPMHQGTSLMAYFYHKACVRDGAENVDPAFYRYPGPKPQSKETSIVMLADVSEAVTHSMHDPSQAEVEAAMTKVFQNRWDDGQFNEAGLTYAEMEKIKSAFVHVWRTLHHERLKYPSTTTGRMAVPPEAVPPSGPSTVPAVPGGTEKA